MINEWQLIRRCEPASSESHQPSADDPRLTELGVPVPGSRGELAADAVDPDEYFEIEKILRATKMGGKYQLLVKWKGHVDATWEPRAHILNETNDAELLREVEDAVQRYRDETRTPDDDGDDPEPPAADASTAPEATGRFPRVRRPPMYYSPTAHLVADADDLEHDTDMSTLYSALNAMIELTDLID
jgi:hypothetical protein